MAFGVGFPSDCVAALMVAIELGNGFQSLVANVIGIRFSLGSFFKQQPKQRVGGAANLADRDVGIFPPAA